MLQILLATLLTLVLAQNETGETRGQWSQISIPLNVLNSLDGGRDQRIVAPNGKTALVLHQGELYLLANDSSRENAEGMPVEGLSELAWSPDSKAVFVTASDGGWVGTWDVSVLQVKESRLVEVPITEKVRSDFVKRYRCDDFKGSQQSPNFGAVKWLNGSQELLILAEVPPVSTCPVWLLMGYVVSVPSGNVLASYSEKEVRSRWGRELGVRHKKPRY